MYSSESLIGSDDAPRVLQVDLRNYKSIGACSVDLGQLTILVGRNGAGKSNFLDALRFVTESLQTSLDHAIKSRGGVDAVRRRSTGHPRNFRIALMLALPACVQARYSFEIAARKGGGFVVRQERMQIRDSGGNLVAHYVVSDGEVRNGTPTALPPAAPDRLYLVTASHLPHFRPAYDALLSMGFYNLNPQVIKELQAPDSGELLHRDGGNLASVIARLAAQEPKVAKRISEYLEKIVPGIERVDRVALGPRETLEFWQSVRGSQHPWRFYAASVSDGTLRALGALTAVTQIAAQGKPVALVGLEEPETALHPAAAGCLMDALREAAQRTQVVVTTHSPDLLNHLQPSTDILLVVESQEGETRIAKPDEASEMAIRDHLYSPGELLGMDQLRPSRRHLDAQNQRSLFDEGEDEL